MHRHPVPSLSRCSAAPALPGAGGQLPALPAPIGWGFKQEPQVDTRTEEHTGTAGPREGGRTPWGSGYGEAGGKAPALPTPREKGTLVREPRQRLQEQELGLAGAKVAAAIRRIRPSGWRQRRGGWRGTAPSPFSGSGNRGSLHTDKLSCGATSAASRALLLTRVCRTGPRGAKRRERITERGERAPRSAPATTGGTGLRLREHGPPSRRDGRLPVTKMRAARVPAEPGHAPGKTACHRHGAGRRGPGDPRYLLG